MIVGKGGFGKVWIVTHNIKKRYYALKEMSKAKFVNQDHIEEERQLSHERAQHTERA